MDNEVLLHYGVKGMKWGVRRYQKEDGSLTSEGKKRYQNNKTSEQQAASEKQKISDMKNRGTLSEDELRQKIKRLELERDLKNLTQSEITPGRKFVQDVMKDAGKKAATSIVSGTALYMVKASISQEFNRKEFAEYVANGGPKKK